LLTTSGAKINSRTYKSKEDGLETNNRTDSGSMYYYRFLPQAIQIIRTKDTSSISAAMYIVFTVGTALWLVFGIYTKNTPVILANAVTSVFAAIILYYKLL
jgi:MtN3 and saliva related transmembrane protein